MKRVAIILLSLVSINVYAESIKKSRVKKANRDSHYFQSRVRDSVDVSNIKEDKIILDRFFDISFERRCLRLIMLIRTEIQHLNL